MMAGRFKMPKYAFACVRVVLYFHFLMSIFPPTDIDILVPSFSGQSYLAHSLPSNVDTSFEIDLTLLTSEPNEVVIFTSHDTQETPDYILLTLEGGAAVFRFNLGSGLVTISSSVRIDDGAWHVVTVAREGEQGYLTVDGETTQGSSSGQFMELNTQIPLFIGGITDINFLPNDTMVNQGFVGCIRDLQIDGESIHVANDALYGISIEQCVEPICPFIACQNGGTCEETSNAAGFECICPDLYTGQFCETFIPVCEPNPCLFGGLCSQLGTTFTCLCPLERGGRLCEQGECFIHLWYTFHLSACFPFSLGSSDIAITVPSFAGGSYIVYPPLTGATTSLTISLYFNPSSPTGVLIFTSLTDTDFADYTFIALIEGYVHYGFNLGDGDALITSTDPVALGVWHTVTVSRTELIGSLIVDDSPALFASSSPPFTGLNVGSSLYLGGHLSFINISSVVGTSVGFSGCVSSVSINGQELDLIVGADYGYGIGTCNVSLCVGEPCLNGGLCQEAGPSFACECTAGFTGPLCGSQFDPCADAACAEGATCQSDITGLSFTCICPLGRGGTLCDQGKSSQLSLNFPL